MRLNVPTKIGLLAVLAGLGLSAVRLRHYTLKAAGLQSRIVPYTVVLLENHEQAKGGMSIPSVKCTTAVRSDGSKSMEAGSPTPGAISERILTFSSGKTVYIMEHLNKKSSTLDLSHGDPRRFLPDPSNNCLVSGFQQNVIGEETVDGYRTVKLQMPPGEGTITQWLALDYGCASIKERAEWSDGQISEKKLIALIPGEPSPALFDESGFEEVPPSRIFPGLGDSGIKVDSFYYSHRPPEDARKPQ